MNVHIPSAEMLCMEWEDSRVTLLSTPSVIPHIAQPQQQAEYIIIKKIAKCDA